MSRRRALQSGIRHDQRELQRAAQQRNQIECLGPSPSEGRAANHACTLRSSRSTAMYCSARARARRGAHSSRRQLAHEPYLFDALARAIVEHACGRARRRLRIRCACRRHDDVHRRLIDQIHPARRVDLRQCALVARVLGERKFSVMELGGEFAFEALTTSRSLTAQRAGIRRARRSDRRCARVPRQSAPSRPGPLPACAALSIASPGPDRKRSTPW